MLDQLLPGRDGCFLGLIGDPPVREQATRLVAAVAAAGTTVRFLCGDNCFDAYELARLVREMGRAPDDVLARILVARAFTAMADLVARIETIPPDQVIVIGGMCTLFFDEDLDYREASRLFYQTLWVVRRHVHRLMLAVQIVPPESQRFHFFRDFRRTFKTPAQVTNGTNDFALQHGAGRTPAAVRQIPPHAPEGRPESFR